MKVNAQCVDFSIIVDPDPFINSEGLYEVVVWVNFVGDQDVDYFITEISILNGLIDFCSEDPEDLKTFNYLNPIMDLSINQTRTKISLIGSGPDLYTFYDKVALFRFVVSAPPGDCFSYQILKARYAETTCVPILNISSSEGTGSFPICYDNSILTGKIERADAINCDNSVNGGVPGVDVKNDIYIDPDYFSCLSDDVATTNQEGIYSFDTYGGMLRTLSADSDADMLCGLTETDEDIITAFLLGSYSFTNNWEYLAADVNFSGVVTTFDKVQLIKLRLGLSDPADFTSWTFPTAHSYYGLSTPPTDYYDQVPICDYELEYGFDFGAPNPDFVAIKIGDMNSSCTDCTSFTYDEAVVRSFGDKIQSVKNSRIKTDHYILDVANSVTEFIIITDQDIDKRMIQVQSKLYKNQYHIETFRIDGKIHIYGFLDTKAIFGEADQLEITLPKGLRINEMTIKDLDFIKHKVEFEAELESVLYPNLVKNSLYINVEGDFNYEIYSIQGNVIQKGRALSEIDVSNIGVGSYYLRVEGENDIFIERFIKLL